MRYLKPIALLVLAGIATAAARAETATTDAAPIKLEPVRVTADLWQSPLVSIPASVTVLDDEALRVGAIRGRRFRASSQSGSAGEDEKDDWFQITHGGDCPEPHADRRRVKPTTHRALSCLFPSPV